VNQNCSLSMNINAKLYFVNQIQTYIAKTQVCYIDFWEAYRGILRITVSVGKETRQTNHIERFNRADKEYLIWLEKHFHFPKH
jgi:hypothetical protein